MKKKIAIIVANYYPKISEMLFYIMIMGDTHCCILNIILKIVIHIVSIV